jgi:hypothetical protein
MFRKFLYLPIFKTVEKIEEKTIKSETNNDFENNTSKFEDIKVENINTFESYTNTVKEKVENFPDLDIKIGKEIK